ncbi:MAG: hypothetical protein GY811_02295 [Myxococcales bacterium]|nr:hypothetical protein [Myxococcales bacterium]
MSNVRECTSGLDASEKEALAKLIRLMARSDGDLSAEERTKIDSIAIDAGSDSFWKLLDAAAASEDSQETILEQIASIGTSDCHEIIYGALYELSIAEAGGEGENELLEQIATGWNLSIGDDPSDA